MHIKQIIIVLVLSCVTSFATAQKAKTISLKNPTSLERKDELIILKRSFLEKKAAVSLNGKYIQLFKNKTPLVVQFDDLNSDGTWDEAVLLQSFKPGEVIALNLAITNAPAAIKAVVRAHARHKRKNADDSFGDDLTKDSIPPGQLGADFTKLALPPFLTEGPAWENDKVGFRIYFDVRNGKDIWGKTTSKMVMDEVGLDTANNYHLLSDWGMDVLKVGKSLGAGSLALQVKLPNGKDSLVRLGGKNMDKVIYEKVADGPLRAIIRLHYPQWKVQDGIPPVDLTEEISIWGGQYFYESKVWVSNAPANAKLVTGIVNLHSKSVKQIKDPVTKLIYTYDRQSENNDNLGMSVMLPSSAVYKNGQTANERSDVLNTYFVASPVSNSKPFVFRFYAAWEKSDDEFTTEDGFRKFLVTQSQKYVKPIKVN